MHQLSTTKSAQRGLSFIGLLFVGAVLALTGVVVAQVVPTVIEYQSILKAANTSKVGGTPAEVRSNFDKNKATGYFDAINGKDLEITKVGDKHVVSFAYTKEIHLAGPAFLLLKYSGKTD
ncbi:MAG: DUF4845 domain-containing protein [Burkholderiaceae bacterium]|nr:DUF4845 domain-containing protein [Burkholderiaceae bacterium]